MKKLNSKLFEKNQVKNEELKNVLGGEVPTQGMGGDGNRYNDFVHDDGKTVFLPAEPILLPVNH